MTKDRINMRIVTVFISAMCGVFVAMLVSLYDLSQKEFPTVTPKLVVFEHGILVDYETSKNGL